MAYGIGIDTGGTYTDAVVYDLDSGKVLAKGKSPTTHHELSLGIGNALDMLPADLVKCAELVSLSTTLATNACVENRGGRAKLVMVGTDMATLEKVQADKKYGLEYADVLCVDAKASFDGRVAEVPDWSAVMAENKAFFDEAESLCVAGLNSLRNGGVAEKSAKEALTAAYPVPFVMACELAAGLNIMERGATALLNARLLPVIDRFIQAVGSALKERGLNAKRMIVRSDGSLMSDSFARRRPVETILSGPSASVMGCRALADCDNCLIIDMGGTTTDISVVKNGGPLMSGGINIGGWRTQIKGVYIDTFGLGGDTRIYIREGRPVLDTRRVEPLCVAAAKWPVVRDELERLMPMMRRHTRQLHEFLYIMRMPENTDRYTDGERRLLEALKGGPQMIGGGRLEDYGRAGERLEREGVIMRCGLTPTDIMHIRGDYSAFDSAASVAAAHCFLRALLDYDDTDGDMARFCNDMYGMVKQRLFENVCRVFIESAYPDIFKTGIGDELKKVITRRWENRNAPQGFFELLPATKAALVGTGAPTHIFLPEVAKALGVECIVPENSEVANAIGAVVADISAQSVVSINGEYAVDGSYRMIITAPGVREIVPDMEMAIVMAGDIAARLAVEEAHRRGAMGELQTEVKVHTHRSVDKEGSPVDLGTEVTARATGRVEV